MGAATIAAVHSRFPEHPDRDPTLNEAMLAGFSAIREIDESDEWYHGALLSAFLCAAWPTLRAQNQ